MSDDTGGLDALLADVRKTITYNKQFLERLMCETVEDDADIVADDSIDCDELEEL